MPFLLKEAITSNILKDALHSIGEGYLFNKIRKHIIRDTIVC